jgi:hypothetical protein
MSEFTQIILRLLWRFYPIAWLTTAIVRGLSCITQWLEDEESYLQLAHDPEDCAYVGGWLSLAEERLNELIVMKAMRLLKRRYRPPDPCGHHPTRAVRTPQAILARLTRLIALYHDHKRLYELRALKLQRLFDQAEGQLEVIRHPVEAQPAAGIVGMVGTIGMIATIAMIGIGAARAASHPVQPIRAPPWLDLFSQIQLIPTRSAYLRERDPMPEMIIHTTAQQTRPAARMTCSGAAPTHRPTAARQRGAGWRSFHCRPAPAVHLRRQPPPLSRLSHAAHLQPRKPAHCSATCCSPDRPAYRHTPSPRAVFP